jgi:hypothetical protein
MKRPAALIFSKRVVGEFVAVTCAEQVRRSGLLHSTGVGGHR